ncbi:tetratricopeptide repeat protein [Iningainema tapete]|uniref:Tetratricopeptide repeat protein 38 n=1 Tax=Iningainema tapete BLCC-T55 TaxID=2748662 RepID=A0A8J6XZ51_9CYAN|nr:tetratricopeptide repeat protein [Iningainema tapete]MBD2775828.1 tetratricopeptide repeat protein [Iningainema tapete BLCC-T55]
MLEDAQGLEVTTNSTEAIAAINLFCDQALAYGKDIEAAIVKGLTADPNCALIHAYAAAYFLSMESGTRKQAIPHLQTAHKYLAEITERERLYVQAISAWAATEIDKAILLHDQIAAKFPRDLISVQQGQYHYFYLGDKQRLWKIADSCLSANPDNHYLYGMVAFGLEQCHRLDEAEKMGRKATAMNPHNPWAHHAVAHVMETLQRVDEGITWMESFADTWENCNTMLYTHNWWHVALYYLERGDKKKVLALYDTRVWGRASKESPKDQVGAIALLLRLELRGVDVGSRWQDLSDYIYPNLHEHSLAFQDLHYVYALARAGHTNLVTRMLLSMQKYAFSVNSYLRKNWVEVAIPAARGMVAHAYGDFHTALLQLQPVMLRLHEIGGSHAQRALFDQIYLDAMCQIESRSQIHCVA